MNLRFEPRRVKKRLNANGSIINSKTCRHQHNNAEQATEIAFKCNVAKPAYSLPSKSSKDRNPGIIASFIRHQKMKENGEDGDDKKQVKQIFGERLDVLARLVLAEEIRNLSC